MENSLAFKIAIAYENFATAIRAKEMSEGLVRHQLKTNCDTWPFELLAGPGARERCAEVAAEADMIIIAVRSREELPDHVKEWIESWLLRKKNSPTFLVALLDEPFSDGTSSLADYLRGIAERGNMEFFCNTDYWSPAEIVETGSRPGFQTFLEA
jgi:hypothetical protein